METVVLILMLLVSFSLVLKLTFQKVPVSISICGLCLLFIGLSTPFAIEQSSTQIQQWLQNSRLMLDTSVILFIDVFMQISFAVLSAQLMTAGKVRKTIIRTYRVLRLFPGLLIFPVLFYTVVQAVFSFPGVSFGIVGWSVAVVASSLIFLMSRLIKYLLPEKDIRLEILFLVNILIAMMGVIATVNGRTAVRGVSDINWDALLGVFTITLFGGLIGFLINKYSLNRIIKKINRL